MAESNVLTAVLAVFMEIANWFTSAIPVISAFFYADGALTFMGVLAVAGLAISVVFLLVAAEPTSLQTLYT